MRFLLFGGTTEGRLLSRRLAEQGGEVTVCVATDYGAEEQGEWPNVSVLTGRRSEVEMTEILKNAALCIDATHPYAIAVTENIQAACKSAGVPYRRLLRPASENAGTRTVASAGQAADYLMAQVGNILLTTGAKELSAYAALPPERLFPRILPTHEGLSACEALGIPHHNILAMQGPFSLELNEALIRQYAIDWVVTKDGGGAGGFAEKAAAACNTGASLVVIQRPTETGQDFDEILHFCEEMISCG